MFRLLPFLQEVSVLGDVYSVLYTPLYTAMYTALYAALYIALSFVNVDTALYRSDIKIIIQLFRNSH